MPHSLGEIWQLLSRVKPWVGVAVVLGVVLAGYYAVQGVRYYDARGIPYVGPNGKEHALLVEIDAIVGKLAGSKPEAKAAATALAYQNSRLEELKSQFERRSANDLLKTLSTAAAETGLELLSITMAALTSELIGETEYEIQPVSLTVKGPAANITVFLQLIHQEIPVASVSAIEIGGLDDVPTSNVAMFFYFRVEDSQDESR